MSLHLHDVHVEGCFRCGLSDYEVEQSLLHDCQDEACETFGCDGTACTYETEDNEEQA